MLNLYLMNVVLVIFGERFTLKCHQKTSFNKNGTVSVSLTKYLKLNIHMEPSLIYYHQLIGKK